LKQKDPTLNQGPVESIVESIAIALPPGCRPVPRLGWRHDGDVPLVERRGRRRPRDRQCRAGRGRRDLKRRSKGPDRIERVGFTLAVIGDDAGRR
jgi:hypothetical protein